MVPVPLIKQRRHFGDHLHIPMQVHKKSEVPDEVELWIGSLTGTADRRYGRLSFKDLVTAIVDKTTHFYWISQAVANLNYPASSAARSAPPAPKGGTAPFSSLDLNCLIHWHDGIANSHKNKSRIDGAFKSVHSEIWEGWKTFIPGPEHIRRALTTEGIQMPGIPKPSEIAKSPGKWFRFDWCNGADRRLSGNWTQAFHGTSLFNLSKILQSGALEIGVNSTAGCVGIYMEQLERVENAVAYITHTVIKLSDNKRTIPFLGGALLELAVNDSVRGGIHSQWFARKPEDVIIRGIHIHLLPIHRIFAEGFFGSFWIHQSVMKFGESLEEGLDLSDASTGVSSFLPAKPPASVTPAKPTAADAEASKGKRKSASLEVLGRRTKAPSSGQRASVDLSPPVQHPAKPADVAKPGLPTPARVPKAEGSSRASRPAAPEKRVATEDAKQPDSKAQSAPLDTIDRVATKVIISHSNHSNFLTQLGEVACMCHGGGQMQTA
jgi:hypothetical protein